MSLTFDEWYLVFLEMNSSTDFGGESRLMDEDLGSSPELCQMAFKSAAALEVECIDPSLLELQPEQSEDYFFWNEDPLPLFEDFQEHNSHFGQEEATCASLLPSPCLELGPMEVDVENPEEIPDSPEPEPMEINAENKEIPRSSPLSPAPYSPQSSRPSSPIAAPPEETDDNIYPVEQILQSWGRKSRRQYLIKWLGYGPEFNCWEPACNVSDDLIMEFEGQRLSSRRLRSR